MNKKIVIVILLIAATCLFLYDIASGMLGKPASSASAQTQVEITTLAPLATPEVQQPTAEPTVDAQATARAAEQAAAEARATANDAVATANAADVALAAENNRTLSIQATDQADQRAHEQRMAELTQNQQALDNETKALENENLALSNEQQRLDNEAQELANEQKRLDNEANRQTGIMILVGTGIIGLVAVAFWTAKQVVTQNASQKDTYTSAKPVEIKTETLPEAFDRLAPIIPVSDGGPGEISVILDDWTGIATIDQLLAIAYGIEDNVSLAIGNWYGNDEEGNPRPFTRSQIERFINAITTDGIGPNRRILAYKMNGHAILKDVGKQYFKKIIEKYG